MNAPRKPFGIKSIRVEDHRARRVMMNPYLVIEAEDEVIETADPIFDYRKDLQHRIIPCGPFFAVEVRPDNGATYDDFVDANEHRQGDIGKVNISGLIADQLFPVVVNTPEESGLHLYMQVGRARRILRREWSVSPYHVLVDDQAALRGKIKWRLELRSPMCYGGVRMKSTTPPCSRKPEGTLYYSGVHLSLCGQHRKAYDDHISDQQSKRSSVTTSRNKK